jgi:hypothetical protein
VSLASPPPGESPELAAARRAREVQAERVVRAQQGRGPGGPGESQDSAPGGSRSPIPPPAIRDPVAWCVWATVALLGWLISPPLVTAAFGGAGVWAYARAWRAGLRRSDCILRDPRLVMLYLGLLAAAGLLAFVIGWFLPAGGHGAGGFADRLLRLITARQ